MLRRPNFSEDGATKAVGLLYILSLVGFLQNMKDEPGCLDALHTAARGRYGPAAAATARKAMEGIAAKATKAAHIEAEKGES